jgi:hypothetical protein
VDFGARIFLSSIRSKGVSIGASSNWGNSFTVAFFVRPHPHFRTGAEDAVLLAEVGREIGLSMRLQNDAVKAA